LFIHSFCVKKEEKLPFAYINYSFYLTDPAFFNLNSIGGYAVIKNEGINGVIVYRKSLDEIMAYDGNCTYQPSARCGVKLSTDQISATDSCCGSVFQLYDGFPTKGPATLPLYEYKVTVENERVTITN